MMRQSCKQMLTIATWLWLSCAALAGGLVSRSLRRGVVVGLGGLVGAGGLAREAVDLHEVQTMRPAQMFGFGGISVAA